MSDAASTPADPIQAAIKEERTFIHDLASPIATMNLILESMIEDAGEGLSSIKGDDLERMKKIHALLGKMTTLLRSRREILIQRSAPTS